MIYLRNLEEKDAIGMLEWMHDPDIQKSFQASMGEKTIEDVLNFIRSASNVYKDGESLHYAITDKNNDEYLGTISLKHIDMKAANAEYAISLRKKAHGRGVGTEATKMVLEKAFFELGLKRVYLNVLDENKAAIRLYEKCGFIYEGTFRNHLFLNDEYKSLRWYAILKDEFI